MESAGKTGIGGQKVTDAILDSRRPNIPTQLTFNAGDSEIFVDHNTIAKLSGCKIANQVNLSGLTFGTSVSNANQTQFISASLGKHDEKQPMHTLDRMAHISSRMSATPGHSVVTTAHHVVAPNSTWVGTNQLSLKNLSSAYGIDHPSSKHMDVIDSSTSEVQAKQALNWEESIGATVNDIMHGCVTAQKDGVSRTSIPICDDARHMLGKGQLSSLVMKHADNLTELLGEHHITTEHYSEPLQKSVRHVIVPKTVADQAAEGLRANLEWGPLAKGITLRCTDQEGNPPSSDVHVAMTLHRNIPEELHNIPLYHTSAMSGRASTMAGALDAAAPTNALTDAMFAKSVKLRKTPNAKSPEPTQAEVTIHGAASIEPDE